MNFSKAQLHDTADALHDKLKSVGNGLIRSDFEYCLQMAPEILHIQQLKKEKDAVILGHSYVHPEILYTVADIVGDSLKLAQEARSLQSKTLVFSAVRFMAETAKILNPEREVLIANQNAGCSLAESITAADVQLLRQQYPDFLFLCYVNTTADVKAECDVCVTSGNVYKIVEKVPQDKIFFLPDRLMGMNLVAHCAKKGIRKQIIFSDGDCYVHEKCQPEDIDYWRARYPDLQVVSHPECHTDITQRSDFVGGTGDMMSFVRRSAAKNYLVLTECGLVSRMQSEMPAGKNFVGSCQMCRYMKANSLAEIRRVLEAPRPEDRIVLDESMRLRAARCLERMFELG
jgi:quinolinate synthase